MRPHDCVYHERVLLVRRLAKHHREKLLERNAKVSDPTFASGASWAVYAIDRVILACDGEDNPSKLGLEGRPPSAVAVQEALFSLVEPEAVERRCESCGTGIYPRAPGRSPQITHYGRGLCSPCWHSADREGRLADYNKLYYTRDELLTEWVLLAREGHTRHQAAERLGMKYSSFCRALQRAAQDGDPRATIDKLRCGSGLWAAS